MTAALDVADPVEIGERVVGGPRRELVGRRRTDHVERPHERLGPEPLVVHAVEAVNDA